jgi:hypothetical protein
LQGWPAPRTLTELRPLLRTTGFWRTYIHHFVAITQPLVKLTRKHIAWHWGEEQQTALDALKRAIRDSRILMPAREDQPYFVVTDASDYVVGVSLEQTYVSSGKRRPVAYFSHLLSPADCSYPTHERKLLAIVFGTAYMETLPLRF